MKVLLIFSLISKLLFGRFLTCIFDSVTKKFTKLKTALFSESEHFHLRVKCRSESKARGWVQHGNRFVSFRSCVRASAGSCSEEVDLKSARPPSPVSLLPCRTCPFPFPLFPEGGYWYMFIDFLLVEQSFDITKLEHSNLHDFREGWHV